MAARRVIGVFLDGYEPSLEEAMRAEGQLPHLDALRARSCVGALEHGSARLTGLAGEHLSTGQSPDDIDRHAAVDFDPEAYTARQVGTRSPTFVTDLGVPTVVFDVPYFDLGRTPNATGVVNWGAHDPGVPATGRPDGLFDELLDRIGRYPAPEFIYATPWASPDHCVRMGKGLVAGLEARTEAVRWLLRDRLPDWEFALVAVSEAHSGIEALWHGVDPDHPLAGTPSAPAARHALREIYRGIDRFVGSLQEEFPDAVLVVFSLHGMGRNLGDVPTMALLPELLYRHATGERRLEAPEEWRADPSVPPPMEPDASWSATVRERTGGGRPERAKASRMLRRAARRVLRGSAPARAAHPSEMAWMPATHYADVWPRMRAFALPSFYDGRIRVNLEGREAGGTVAVAEYASVLDELESLVRACTDPATGRSVVESVDRPALDRGKDPTSLGRSECDLVIHWRGPLAFEHPELGLIGPLPFRRTGGHTRPLGSLAIAGPGIAPGDMGVLSSFDVVPTFFELLDRPVPESVSGAPVVVG